jgi:hypothetical protein
MPPPLAGKVVAVAGSLCPEALLAASKASTVYVY